MNRLSFKQCISCATLCTAFLSLGASAQVLDTTRIYRIGEVVVTGSNHATGRNLLPYTVSTVKSSQLEATGQSQLLSAISGQVPSLFVSERNVLGLESVTEDREESRYEVLAVLLRMRY